VASEVVVGLGYLQKSILYHLLLAQRLELSRGATCRSRRARVRTALQEVVICLLEVEDQETQIWSFLLYLFDLWVGLC
jgi:hypothetical protein